MIRKLRVKLVCILMALLTVMLGVTFGLVLHFAQQSLEAESLRTLANFVSQKLATIDSVLSTATHFVLKKYKVDGVILEEEHADHRLAVTP